MEEINKEEVNRYLHEKMGECYHNWKLVEDTPPFRVYHCWKCELEAINPPFNLDLFSPEGFFILFNWAKGEPWWHKEFSKWLVIDWIDMKQYSMVKADLINPEVFPIEVYNYLRGREK